MYENTTAHPGLQEIKFAASIVNSKLQWHLQSLKIKILRKHPPG
jgi:hypothetical protein